MICRVVLETSIQDHHRNTIRYRLGNTHAAGMRALGRARPEVGEAEAPLVRELGHAMRFANAAHGSAAGI